MLYILIFFASFGFVATKAFQTLNIAKGHHTAILPTSFAIVTMEVFIVTEMVRSGVGWIVLPLGFGGALGCWFSMWLHKKIFYEKEKIEDEGSS